MYLRDINIIMGQTEDNVDKDWEKRTGVEVAFARKSILDRLEDISLDWEKNHRERVKQGGYKGEEGCKKEGKKNVVHLRDHWQKFLRQRISKKTGGSERIPNIADLSSPVNTLQTELEKQLAHDRAQYQRGLKKVYAWAVEHTDEAFLITLEGVLCEYKPKAIGCGPGKWGGFLTESGRNGKDGEQVKKGKKGKRTKVERDQEQHLIAEKKKLGFAPLNNSLTTIGKQRVFVEKNLKLQRLQEQAVCGQIIRDAELIQNKKKGTHSRTNSKAYAAMSKRAGTGCREAEDLGGRHSSKNSKAPCTGMNE